MEEKNSRSAFVLFAEKGETEKVEELYGQFSDLAAKKEELYFALYFAVFSGQEEVVQFLLSKGIDSNFVVGSYLTPLHAAVLLNHENIVKILLDHGADVNPKIKVTSDENNTVETDYFCSPLLGAIYKNHEGIVNLLLQKGAKVNVKLNSVDVKFEDDFEKQLTIGSFSSYNLKDSSYCHIGYTPLHFALWHDNKSLAKLLLELGANINARSNLDETPLCVSCRSKDTSLIELIVEKGADMKSQVGKGKSLLHHILFNIYENSLEDCYEWYKKKVDIENNKAFRTMLKLGADPNSWSRNSKESVLHFAVEHGMVNAVHLLLKYGANVNAVNGKDKTPFECAVESLGKILEDIQDHYYYISESSTDDEDYYGDNNDLDSSDEERRDRTKEKHRRARSRRRQRLYDNRKIYDLSDKEYAYYMYQYQRDHNRDEGFTVLNEPDPFRMICQLLVRELVKLEATGKKNVEQNVTLLQTPFVKPYYIGCKNEIEKLRKILIVEGVTHYDFLVASDLKLKESMENNITEAFEDTDWKLLFPFYSHFLRVNKKRGLRLNCPDVDSNGSSDEEQVNCSVQVQIKERKERRDDCVLS